MADTDPSRRALRVALGGGVGTGKSSVGIRLARLGAYRVDADQLARDVVEPGTDGLAAVVERFGPSVVTADGRMDRAAVATLVFADSAARKDLEAILHPRIAQLSRQRIDQTPPGGILVYEIPLITSERVRADFDLVVIVETSLDLRLQRLARRGLDEAAARARIAAQPTDEELRALADEVIVNDGTEAQLDEQVADLWERLVARQRALA